MNNKAIICFILKFIKPPKLNPGPDLHEGDKLFASINVQGYQEGYQEIVLLPEIKGWDYV